MTQYPDARPETVEDGKRYEEFVAAKVRYLWGKELHFFDTKESQIHGETQEGLEIKFDGRLKETGNLYIEMAEKSRADNKKFVPSGSFKKADNTKVIWIGDYKEAFLFDKIKLQELSNAPQYRHVQIPTSQGFLIPREDAAILAKRHLRF